jgi:TRAP-type C4-dicarboxylate transport system permease small subunit
MLRAASRIWARVELAVAAVLAAAITLLILTNVITRAAGNAIYWIDEAAIYAMIWMAFLAASASIHERSAVAVTFLPDMAGGASRQAFRLFIDLSVLAFAALMVWFCFRWFRPDLLAANGFDVAAFQGATFNFIYAEPTSTLGIAKWQIWLVMPIFAAGMVLHSVNNLVQTLRNGGDAAQEIHGDAA